MIKLIIFAAIIFFILLAWKEVNAHTPDQWIVFYQRDCQTVKENQACKQRLEKTLSRAFSNRWMVLYYLEKNHLPSWLSTVPIIESEYRSDIVSKSGAVGLWQFMPATAESFGLKTRDDPIESTKTACVFIKHLFSKYKNWKTALMAYNAGEPRIDNYLANKGDPLTSETLNYYPQLMALQKIINDITTGSKKYGFKPKSIKTHFKRYILYAMFL